VPNTQAENGREPVTTDKVGEELGEIHQYGGLDTGMTGMCIDILNDFMSPEVSLPKVANTGETAPLSEALAAILDVAASELVARGGNEDEPEPGRFGPAGGPFASLSREDRFRALYDVENRANQFGEVEAQVSETTGIENGRNSRTGSFVVATPPASATSTPQRSGAHPTGRRCWAGHRRAIPGSRRVTTRCWATNSARISRRPTTVTGPGTADPAVVLFRGLPGAKPAERAGRHRTETTGPRRRAGGRTALLAGGPATRLAEVPATRPTVRTVPRPAVHSPSDWSGG